MGGRKPRVRDVEKQKEEEKPTPKIKKRKVERRTLVRVLNTDLDGERPIIHAIRGIKGVGFLMAKAIVHAAGLDPKKKLIELNESEINKIEDIVKNPNKYGIPPFILNRRKDPATGRDMHLSGTELEIAQRFDIKKEIELRTYRGWRHMFGQPVRGQRTRSHFRHGAVVGVVRKAVRIQQEKK